MAISFSRYVDITSSVGAGSSVTRRELIGRLFTTSDLLPTNSFVEMDTLTDVGDFFGTTSEEFLRATFYFGFISKNTTSPNRISFARWADVDTAPRITGVSITTLLATFNAITDGAFKITLGGVELAVSGLDFSLSASFADVATTIQTGIRLGTGAVFTNATVTFDAVNSRFVFVGGETGPSTISVAAPDSGTDILGITGWTNLARFSDGVTAETVTGVLTASIEASNNFGSFLFVPTLTDAEILEAATVNDTFNVEFMYCTGVTSTNAEAVSASVLAVSGVAMTLLGVAGEFPEMGPMAVLAATDYDARASVQNYMFQQFNLTPTVLTNADANRFDPLRVNYYGQTQSAGNTLNFYQRGVLTGTISDPLDMNTYANEQWLKSESGAAIMDLLLSTARVPANNEGRGQILTVVTGVVLQAVENGTIGSGRELNDQQRLFIAQITGDPLAFQQVANAGYWLDVTFRDDGGSFTAVYTLVYAKDNVVRKVEGTHTLI